MVKDYHFNSHAHVERDIGNFFSIIQIQISTHTLTWSVTYWLPITGIFCNISTHTLTWSVTTAAETNQPPMVISTHTLTWSVTLDVVYIWCLLNVMRTYFFI